MTNDTASPTTPVQTAEKLTPEEILRLYPSYLVDKMSADQIMALPSEVLVQILGAQQGKDGRCAISTINAAMKIESDTVIGTLIPNTIDPPQNGKPAAWKAANDLDGDTKVEHHELLARLIRVAQIARERGVDLKDIKFEEVDCKEIQPIADQLVGKKKGPEIC